jgi:pimeloyl-ACP methyl ester carboxylesterase
MQTFLIITVVIVLALAVWTQIVVAKALSAHPPQGIFVPVTGGRLHVRDIGPRDAPPERTIVLLHGASCNLLALTLPLGKPLSQHFRVIAIDRPGHGHSDRPCGRQDASPARQAQLIAEAMTELKVPRAIILGHSLAGAVATTLALDHRDRVAGLVLLGPVTHPWPGGVTWYYHPGSWPVVGWLFSNLMPVPGAALTMQAGVDGVFAPQTAPAGYVEDTAVRLMLRPGSFMANAQDVTGLLDYVSGICDRYGEITAPTLVIAGADDTVVSSTIHTAAFARALPPAIIHILPGVGHVPHHAATEFVVEEIKALSLRAGSSAS